VFYDDPYYDEPPYPEPIREKKMCTYCMMADWVHHWVPQPWTPTPWAPQVPTPAWTQEQLTQLLDILRRVKEMEDKLGGCPNEDVSKLDFLRTIQDRLDALEQKAKDVGSAPIAEPTE
jgi:hypothetical protein